MDDVFEFNRKKSMRRLHAEYLEVADLAARDGPLERNGERIVTVSYAGRNRMGIPDPFPDTKSLELHEVQPPAAARAGRFAAKNAPAGQRQIRIIPVNSVPAGR